MCPTLSYLDVCLKVYSLSSKSKTLFYKKFEYSCEVNHNFRNNYTIDILLRIIEEFSDEFKVLAAGAMTHLCTDPQI